MPRRVHEGESPPLRLEAEGEGDHLIVPDVDAADPMAGAIHVSPAFFAEVGFFLDVKRLAPGQDVRSFRAQGYAADFVFHVKREGRRLVLGGMDADEDDAAGFIGLLWVVFAKADDTPGGGEEPIAVIFCHAALARGTL